MHQDPERRVLAVSSPDGASARTLEALGDHADSVKVEWSPAGTAAATFWKFSDFSSQEVGFIGLNDENFKGISVNGMGLRTQYSPTGQQLLYSTYSQATGYKPELNIVDANGQDIGENLKALTLNTFADKCAFSGTGTILYCGVPADPKYGFGLEPGILEGVPDDIYRIDLTTGLKKKIAVPVNEQGDPAYAVDTLFVSSDEKHLFFRDTTTGQLIKIDL